MGLPQRQGRSEPGPCEDCQLLRSFRDPSYNTGVAEFTPRKRTRLKGYDYSQAGAYFFTICAHQQRCIFARVERDSVQLSRFGIIVGETWLALPRHYAHIDLDSFIVMPNHVHGIVIYKACIAGRRRRADLPHVLGSLKSFSTKAINVLRGTKLPPIWQRGFNEHVLRPEEDINDYRQYIEENPLKWHFDELNASPT